MEIFIHCMLSELYSPHFVNNSLLHQIKKKLQNIHTVSIHTKPKHFENTTY